MIHPRILELLSLPQHAQKSAEWFLERTNKISSTDIDIILNHEGAFNTPLGLFAKKTFPGNHEPLFMYAINHGNAHENHALLEYERTTGKITNTFGFITHRTYKWLGASPDAITLCGRVVEIKCPLKRKITPEIPSHYVGQIQVLMEVLDLNVLDFVQYKPNLELPWRADGTPETLEFQITEVQRDRSWFAERLPILYEFYSDMMNFKQTGKIPVRWDNEKDRYMLEKYRLKAIERELQKGNIVSSGPNIILPNETIIFV